MEPLTLSQKHKQDWCDSGIKGTNWCAAEEASDLNERTKRQQGVMFAEREPRTAATAAEMKDWCDKGIKTDAWCDGEVERTENVKTVDDKSLYEGPTKAAW